MQSHSQKSVSKKLWYGVPFIALLGFVALKMYPVIHGPSISIDTLKNGTVLNDPLIALNGTAAHAQDLIINGAPVPTSPDGSFNDRVLLSPGYNLITLSATDRYGKTETKNYAIMLSENPGGTFTANVPPYPGNL